jgi:uncharacterized membrane protein (UPF0127 family)
MFKYFKLLNILGSAAGIVLAVGMLIYAYIQTRPQYLPVTALLSYKGENFYLETAVSQDQLTRGLKFRSRLESNHGMLFKLGRLYTHVPFWMFQTHIPLQIVFLKDNLVTTVISHAVPCANPCPIYYGQQANQVIELPINTVNFRVGDRLDLKPYPG